jgi:hypothetical protein
MATTDLEGLTTVALNIQSFAAIYEANSIVDESFRCKTTLCDHFYKCVLHMIFKLRIFEIRCETCKTPVARAD